MKKPLIRIIKKAKQEDPTAGSETGFVVDPNKWSKAVRSWIVEFQKNARSESLPAFDRLFESTGRR